MSFCCVAFLFSPFLDDVLNSDLWVSTISSSNYYESVLNVKVPTMTSNTSPSGEAFESSNAGSIYTAFNAFNENSGYDWSSGSTSSVNSIQYVGYKFTENVCIKKVLYKAYWNPGWTNLNLKAKIQASNDGNTWVDISNTTNESITSYRQIVEFNIANNNYYKMYRVYYTEASQYVPYDDRYLCNCVSLQFYGRVQN